MDLVFLIVPISFEDGIITAFVDVASYLNDDQINALDNIARS